MIFSSVLGLVVTLSTFLFIGVTSSLTYNVGAQQAPRSFPRPSPRQRLHPPPPPPHTHMLAQPPPCLQCTCIAGVRVCLPCHAGCSGHGVGRLRVAR